MQSRTNAWSIHRSPGDGLCLFHSLAYSIGTNIYQLKHNIYHFLLRNPTLLISGVELQQWIQWSEGIGVDEYVRTMSHPHSHAWGGALEMILTCLFYKKNIYVWEYSKEFSNIYKCISKVEYHDLLNGENHGESRNIKSLILAPSSPFAYDRALTPIHLLYSGRMHYDSLIPQ
jgi:hypothetical protein